MITLDIPGVIQTNEDKISQDELYDINHMDLCTFIWWKTLILHSCTSVDLTVIVIDKVWVINSPHFGPCKLDPISSCHPNTSYQTLRVLLSLDYCTSHFFSFLETGNSLFISTRGYLSNCFPLLLHCQYSEVEEPLDLAIFTVYIYLCLTYSLRECVILAWVTTEYKWNPRR